MNNQTVKDAVQKDTAVKKYLNFINGEWVESESGRFTQNTNPVNGEVLGEVVASTKADVDKAVQAAKAAQKSGVTYQLQNVRRFYIKLLIC